MKQSMNALDQGLTNFLNSYHTLTYKQLTVAAKLLQTACEEYVLDTNGDLKTKVLCLEALDVIKALVNSKQSN